MLRFVMIGLIAAMPGVSAAFAQSAATATSAGPGRIECKAAASCTLGIGIPAKMKYQVNADALKAEDKDRLAKDCKPGGKTSCIVTVTGTEMNDPMKIKASGIKWFN